MRWIDLNCNDCQMFHDAINPAKYAFLMVHKDAMKKMWHDQGRKFWLQFLIAYRMYQFKYGVIQDFIRKAKLPNDCYIEVVDEALVYIHKQFVEGTFSTARSIIEETVIVAQNESLLTDIRTYNSIVGSPFFQKDTRDAFRNLFGSCNPHTPVAIKAFLQAPMYCHFAGAVVNVLQRWLLASSVDPERIKAMEDEVNVKQQSKEWLKHLKGNFLTYVQIYWGNKLEGLVFLQGNPSSYTLDLSPENDMDDEQDLSDCHSVSPEPTCSKHKQNKRKKKKVSQLQKHIKSLHNGGVQEQSKLSDQASKDNGPKGVKLHTSIIATESCLTVKIEKGDAHSEDDLVTKLNGLLVDTENSKTKDKISGQSNNKHRPETVTEKLDIIEDCVKSTGGLGIEEFMLLLQAGKQLMGGGDHIDADKVELKPKSQKKIKLHKCAFCKKEEPSPKTFKKCARCKSENFHEPRYYCSRECQVEDWEEWHREEHNKIATTASVVV